MPTISNAELNVITDLPEDQASVTVTCDIAFTEVELNAMNLLGLQYTLQCRVINKDVLDDYPVVTYPDITFPRVAGQAERYDRAIFADSTPMNNLHERLIGKDKLVAELTLKNTETGEEVTQRTEIVDVDLAVR